MKSSKRGKSISASVEEITPFGIWMLVKGKEYFLNYENFPYFKNQKKGAIEDVVLLHEKHIYFPRLDIDLEIDNLENPEKYPLKFRAF